MTDLVPTQRPTDHTHICPDCRYAWQCDSPAGTPCANAASNGNPNRLCDPCWGMRRPARTPKGGNRD